PEAGGRPVHGVEPRRIGTRDRHRPRWTGDLLGNVLNTAPRRPAGAPQPMPRPSVISALPALGRTSGGQAAGFGRQARLDPVLDALTVLAHIAVAEGGEAV